MLSTVKVKVGDRVQFTREPPTRGVVVGIVQWVPNTQVINVMWDDGVEALVFHRDIELVSVLDRLVEVLEHHE